MGDKIPAPEVESSQFTMGANALSDRVYHKGLRAAVRGGYERRAISGAQQISDFYRLLSDFLLVPKIQKSNASKNLPQS